MNERTLLANARYTSSIVKELYLLEGSVIRVTRQRSNQGTPQFLRVAEGLVTDITLSCLVMERTDMLGQLHSTHPQVITYTFSDFLTGLYDYEVVG